jgi:hypothetical protein
MQTNFTQFIKASSVGNMNLGAEKIKRNCFTIQQRNLIYKLFLEGKPYLEIAHELGNEGYKDTVFWHVREGIRNKDIKLGFKLTDINSEYLTKILIDANLSHLFVRKELHHGWIIQEKIGFKWLKVIGNQHYKAYLELKQFINEYKQVVK